VRQYEKLNYVQLGHKDSRILEIVKKHVPKRIELLTKIFDII